MTPLSDWGQEAWEVENPVQDGRTDVAFAAVMRHLRKIHSAQVETVGLAKLGGPIERRHTGITGEQEVMVVVPDKEDC